jgi:hypothetical protein
VSAAAELALAQELDRRVYARAAQVVSEHPWGWSQRHHGMPEIHMLNSVRLRAPLAATISAGDLVAIADDELAGLWHRQVVLDDAPAAERLSGELEAWGWQRERAQFMVLGEPALLVSPDPRAREIGEQELRRFQRSDLSQPEHGGGGKVAELVVQALALVRAATPTRGFGAGEDGQLQSAATLFLDRDVHGRRVAMVESVATLRAQRLRGLAKAVVGAATRAALDWGADLVVVPADADNWPQLLYAGLGFSSVGRQVVFTRSLGSA